MASITVIDPQNVTVNVDPPPTFTVNIDTAKQGPGLTPNGPNLSIQYRSGNGVTGSSDFVVNPSNGQAAITSIYSTGNIQASYFLGNGSQLTGISSPYGNANVAAYLPTYGGNILANVVQANVLATAILPVNAAIDIGTATSSFRDIYVGNVVTPAGNQGNATQIQPASGAGQSGVAFVDAITGQAAHISAGDAVFTGSIETDGYITADLYIQATGNIISSGNVSGTYFLGNGSQLTGLPQQYSNANVAAYLPTYTGNLQGGNLLIIDSVYIQGNLEVQGNTTYLNSNVVNIDDKDIVIANGATTLTQANGAGFIVGQGNLANVIFNNPANAWMIYPGIATPGNITGTYIFGNGSQLTGLPALYGNANVAEYLPTYTGNLAASSDIIALYSNAATQSNAIANLQAAQYSNANVGNYLPTYNGDIGAGNITVTETLGANNIVATEDVSSNTMFAATLLTVGGYLYGGDADFGGNVLVGAITATGNITADYYFGNVRDTTGINSFANIAVAGQTTVTADSTTDTLTLVAGTNITITTDAANNRITITSTGGGGGETFDPFLLAGM